MIPFQTPLPVAPYFTSQTDDFTTNNVSTVLNPADIQENARDYYYTFIGLKQSSQLFDNYRVFARGNVTGISSQRAVYQSAVQRMIKPKDKIQQRPKMYTLYEDAHNDNVGAVVVCSLNLSSNF